MTYFRKDKRGKFNEMEYIPHEDIKIINNNLSMTKYTRKHLVSAGVTFVSTFVLTIAFTLQSPDFTFSQEALLGLSLSALMVGTRAVAKLVVEWATEV